MSNFRRLLLMRSWRLTALARRLKNAFDVSHVRNLMVSIDLEESNQIESLLEARAIALNLDSPTSNDILGSLSTDEVFALGYTLACSTSSSIQDRIRDWLDADEEPPPGEPRWKQVFTELSPGLLHLMSSKSFTISNWAKAQLNGLPEPGPDSRELKTDGLDERYEYVIRMTLSELAEVHGPNERRRATIWAQVNMILLYLSKQPAVITAFTPRVQAALGEPQSYFSDVVKCYAHLLAAPTGGVRVWSPSGSKGASQNVEYSFVLLNMILDNPKLVEMIQQEGEQKRNKRDAKPSLAMDWMRLHLLVMLEDEAISKKFPDAIKFVAFYLFEKLQKGQLTPRAGIHALEHGVNLLDHFLSVDAEEMPEFWHKSFVATISSIAAIHAKTLTGIALQGLLPNSLQRVAVMSAVSTASRQFIRKLLELDAESISWSVYQLSELSRTHARLWKRRCYKDDQGKTKNAGQPTPSELLASAAMSPFPNPTVRDALWAECYRMLENEAAEHVLEVVLPPLAKLATIVPPEPVTYLTMGEAAKTPEYTKYRHAIRTSIDKISRALREVRDVFRPALEEFYASLSEDHLNLLCANNAEYLIALNLSPDEKMHLAAQNIIRAAYSEATERADCFRFLMQSNPAGSLRGLIFYLEDFISTSNKSMEANELAKWAVTGLSDVLEVLCSRTDGLLRSGTPLSWLASESTCKQVSARLPRVWDLMCASLASLFSGTRRWAKVIDRSDLTVWLRNVNVFATEVADQLNTVHDALVGADKFSGASATKTPSERLERLANDMAKPVGSAVGWLTLNDPEIMYETLHYVTQALTIIAKNGVALPTAIREDYLEFIIAQTGFKNPAERSTLMTIPELIDLRHLVDPSSKPVEISDDEDVPEEENEVVEVLRPSASSTVPNSSALREARWWKTATPTSNKTASALGQAKSIMTQAKLDFSKPAPVQPRAPPSGQAPAPALYVPVTANKFKAATNDRLPTRSRPTVASSHESRLAQMRADFRSARPLGAAAGRRPPAPPSTGPAWQEPTKEKLTSMAKSTSKQTSGDDSPGGSSAEEDGGAKGLAALRPQGAKSKRAAPIRTQTKMLDEDTEWQQLRKEQEEAERRRRLRAPPDLTFLHQSILSWPFNDSSEAPPLHDTAPRPIPKKFSSPAEYMSVFGPLLLMECWAQLQNAKEEIHLRKTVSVQVSSRNNVDNFVDINVVYSNRSVREDLSETDIVFIREANKVDGRTALAKVQTFRRHYQGHQAVLRLCLLRNTDGLNSALGARSNWEVCSLFSLSTLHRECTALLCAPNLDLRQQIFNGRCASRQDVPSGEVEKTMKQYLLNAPQARAVLGSLRAPGFSLIQGPPGTGKTKTICALIARFMANRNAAAEAPSVDPRRIKPIGPKAKILVCAPSNAAIDELVKRIKLGVPGPDGTTLRPTVLRLGREEAINIEAKDVSLEYLLDQAVAGIENTRLDSTALHNQIRDLQAQRVKQQAELQEAQAQNDINATNTIRAKLRVLMSERTTLMAQLDSVKDEQRAQSRQMDAERRKMRLSIVMGADVICSTLAAAGQDTVASLGIDFETVVIDEAAQAVELSTLIPLRYGCKQCIMVGDPNQLPPTVLSKPAERLGYNQSLFVRLFDADAVYLLR